MAVKRIDAVAPFGSATVEDILDFNMTSSEFRVYSYYRSCTPNYTMSAKVTADKFGKGERYIKKINESLIAKGYLLIVGNSNPTYYVGADMVLIAREENKEYLKRRDARYKKISENRKSKPHLKKSEFDNS